MSQKTWILLSEARARLLKYWLPVFALMTLFLLIQTSTGMITGIQRIVWGWHFLCLFPGLLLLTGSAWLKRHTDKMLNPNAFRVLLWLECFYLELVVLVFLLSRKAIAVNDYGLDVYYLKSLWILTPINTLLLCGLGLMLFGTQNMSKPNSEAILQLVQEKTEAANSNQYTYQSSCFEKIREGNIQEALEKTSKWFENKDETSYHQLVLLQGQYHLLQQNVQLNTLDKNESQIQRNKIMVALIDMVKDIKG